MKRKKAKQSNAWGIVSLVLGILSLVLVFAPYFGILLAIAAVVFYGIQKKHESTGAAVAGLITGIIGIILNVIMLIFVIGFLAYFGAFEGTYEDISIIETEDVLDGSDQEETAPVVKSPDSTQKIKSASMTIDRVTDLATNLEPIRITIQNTGDVSISPKFDVIVTDYDGNKICEGSPFIGIGTIYSGQKKTDEIQIFCTIGEDGDYLVTVNMLDRNFNKLASDSKTITINYWGKFGLN